MDKTTKGFVIAACVVVIGSGSVFLLEYGARFAQDLKTILDTNKAEKARVERNAALTRRTKECRA